MSQFPLYDIISDGIPDKDLTRPQKKCFMKKIIKMDKDGESLIYTLIRVFHSKNILSPDIGLYNSILDGTNISFDLEKFPNKLKQILYKFIGIHLNKMKEEMKINKYRCE